jgi:membrane protein
MSLVFKSLFKRIYKEYKERYLSLYSVQITYYILLSIIPMLIVLVSIFEVFNTSISNILIDLTDILPIDLITFLSITGKTISRGQSIGFGFVGFILGLWFASRALYALIRALNKAYHTKENRRYTKVRITAIMILLLIILIIFSGFILFGVSNIVISLIQSRLPASILLQRLVSMLGFIVGGAVVLLSVATIYSIAPNKKVRFRYALVGSLVFTTLWFFFTLLLNVYFKFFSQYSKIFGYLGLIIILIIYINISSVLFLVCAEINNELSEMR